MKFRSKMYILVLGVFTLLSGCASNTHNDRTRDSAYPGTETVFVGISVDKKGRIKTTTDKEILHPGQKAIFSSSHEFEIVFDNNKSPVGKPVLKSDNGIVVIKVPKDIFEDERFVEEFSKNRELVFHYGIKVGDLWLDPPFIVKPR